LQRVVDLWLGYRDGDGVLLNVRPHWAKEWWVLLFDSVQV